jgi:type I restriction enzyme S subunit
VDWEDLWFVPAEHVRRDEQYVRLGDILISTANSYELVGKVALVSSKPRTATLGAFIALIRPRDGINSKFLYHQLAWGKTQSRIRETASTTTNISNVSTTKLAELDLRIPALDEQDRVVAEIEKQFSRLDEALVGLKRTHTKLDRYRASVLAAACNGSLVGIDASRWPRRTLGEVATTIRNGYSGKPDAQEGTRIFRISAVRRLKLDSSDVRYLSGPISQYKENRVEPGDVLFTRYNGTRNLVGVCAVVPSSIPPTIHPDKLIRVRVPDEILAPNMLAVLASAGTGRAHMEARIRTTAGQSGISGSDLKTLPLAIPPRDVQEAILLELARRLSVVDQMNVEITNGLSKVTRLQNSILTEAFGRAD